MRLLNRYFFSLHLDIFAFLSFLPLFFLDSVVADSEQGAAWSTINFALIGLVLVDGSHIYTTTLVTYFDRKHNLSTRRLFYLVPVAVLLGLSTVLMFFGIKVFFMLISYLAIFHFMRQQFGWMKLATGFDPETPRYVSSIDIASVYVIILYSIDSSASYVFG